MYRCEECKRVTNPGEKQNRVVVEKREKIYSSNDNCTSKGFEIVKEKVVCGICFLSTSGKLRRQDIMEII
jgi:hypothetical protein